MPVAHPLRGAILCVSALALFACMDTVTKYLAQSHAAPLIVGVRYLGNLVLMVALLGPTHGRRHVPDAVSLLGMAVIAGSGAILALKTRRPPVKRTV